VNEQEVIEQCGEDGIRRLVTEFYRQVREDDLLGPIYPSGEWEAAEERLAEFLLFRLGASTRYLEMRGHPRLRMRHLPFRIGEAERDRWLELMRAAMERTGVPAAARGFLDPYFTQTADFMRNQPEGE
jgi:hemoglobin